MREGEIIRVPRRSCPLCAASSISGQSMVGDTLALKDISQIKLENKFYHQRHPFLEKAVAHPHYTID